jgi:hypothetical protein
MMDWIRWQFGQPTAADVLKRMGQRLNEAGATRVTFNENPPEVRFSLKGAQMHSNFVHLMKDLLRAKGGRARDVEFNRYVDGIVLRPMSADRPEDANDYDSVQSRLIPLLRTRVDMGKNALNAANSLTLDKEALERASNDTPWRPVAGDYIAMLGLDTPDSTARVAQGLLDRWGVSFETAFDDALQNLRGLSPDSGWRRVAPGLWQGAWNDSYEPSRLLLPDVIYRSGVAHPVVMVPLRHVLLVADANDLAGLALMASACKQLRQEHSRWLSCRPLQLVEREWQPFEAPDALRQMFQELISVEDSEDYTAQKDLIEQRTAEDSHAPFVGSAQLVQFKDSERVVSYSVWSDGLDTLLPHTDLVAFASQEKPDEMMVVAWADAVRIAGHHMQPVDDMHPPRMRVNVFPTEDEQAKLRAVKTF